MKERMKMRFLIIISSDENADKTATPKEREEVFGAYMKYTEDLGKAGVMLAGEALHPSSKNGARVSVKNGKRNVTDGPFAEAKEVVGGYYLIQVKSKEEAIEWGARCPGAQYGTIEVREVMEFPK
jgi:hypothetical protein